MKVNVNKNGELKNVGTVRLIDGKVVFDISEKGIENVLKNFCKFSPSDGEIYMKALEAQFSRSSIIIFDRENIDSK